MREVSNTKSFEILLKLWNKQTKSFKRLRNLSDKEPLIKVNENPGKVKRVVFQSVDFFTIRSHYTAKIVDCGKSGGTLCRTARVIGDSGAAMSCLPRKRRFLFTWWGWKWHDMLLGGAWCFKTKASLGWWLYDSLYVDVCVPKFSIAASFFHFSWSFCNNP